MYVFSGRARKDTRECLQLKEHDVAIQAGFLHESESTCEENHLELKEVVF